jgi:hypothetical protein
MCTEMTVFKRIFIVLYFNSEIIYPEVNELRAFISGYTAIQSSFLDNIVTDNIKNKIKRIK